jgi:hypothetical protein
MQGAFQLDVGWARTALVYPGILFEDDQAGKDPVVVRDDLLFGYDRANAENFLGGIYYPGQTVTMRGGAVVSAATSIAAVAVALAVAVYAAAPWR